MAANITFSHPPSPFTLFRQALVLCTKLVHDNWVRIVRKLSALWVVAKITRICSDSNVAILVDNLVHDTDSEPCKYSGVISFKEKANKL